MEVHCARNDVARVAFTAIMRDQTGEQVGHRRKTDFGMTARAQSTSARASAWSSFAQPREIVPHFGAASPVPALQVGRALLEAVRFEPTTFRFMSLTTAAAVVGERARTGGHRFVRKGHRAPGLWYLGLPAAAIFRRD